MSLPVDLIVEPLGDLQISGLGDLAHTENYNNSVLRRLATPVDGYARFVLTETGVEEIDTEVFSRLFNFLSTPLTDLSLQLLDDLIKESLDEDDRVEILSIDVRARPTDGLLEVEVRYQDALTQSVNTLTVSP